ncbi:MAG: hypothetical protein ABI432_16190 [Flavobacteriales bacterium]
MSGTKATRGMRFTCDQRWEDMEAHGRDRFCSSCQKPVVDFTGWERDALVGWFKDRPDTCGMFRAEQVDPSLVAMKELDLGLRRGSLAALAALTLTTAQAQREPAAPVRMEQTPGSVTRTVSKEQPRETSTDRCWVEKETIPSKAKTERRSARRKLYVSTRFPFVHLRRRHTMGRITMGCPSF